MSLLHLLACTGWAWPKQDLKNTHKVILFLKVLLGWVTTKSKVCNTPEEIKHAVKCFRQFWRCVVGITLMNGNARQPSVHNQTLASLLRLRGKEKNDGRVTCSVNAAFSSTILRSSDPLKRIKLTTQHTTFTHKRLWQILLNWIGYKKPSNWVCDTGVISINK